MYRGSSTERAGIERVPLIPAPENAPVQTLSGTGKECIPPGHKDPLFPLLIALRIAKVRLSGAGIEGVVGGVPCTRGTPAPDSAAQWPVPGIPVYNSQLSPPLK